MGKIKKEDDEPDYKQAYIILMDYWDCIPDEEKKIVDQRLKLAGL